MRVLPFAAMVLLAANLFGQTSSSNARKAGTVHSSAQSQGTKGAQGPAPATKAASAKPAEVKAEANTGPAATDAERQAVIFTSYDLDVRLTPQTRGAGGARAGEGAQQRGAAAGACAAAVDVDADVAIGARGGRRGGDVWAADGAERCGPYGRAARGGGGVATAAGSGERDWAGRGVQRARAADVARLEAIGTPVDMALHSDWDRISADFVGLRGFGNVFWYPVASVPVFLGDGAKMFTEIGHQKLRQAAAKISMRVTQDFFGVAPNVAILDGQNVALTLPAKGEAPDPTVPQVVSFSLPPTTLGFNTPSIFVASRYQHDGDGVSLYTRSANEANAQSYLTAVTLVQPLLKEWLGSKAKTTLSILDLPEAEDAPYETGAALLLPLHDTDAQQLTGPLSHALAHAYFWSSAGVAERGCGALYGQPVD